MKYNPDNIIHRRTLAIHLIDKLAEAGFERCKRLEGKYGDLSEAVYAKRIHGRFIVAVYTSCNQRDGAWEARNSGKDAIRVVTLYIKNDGSTAGLSKHKRIHRTGHMTDIVGRVSSRIDKAWEVGKRPTRCECGAPKFLSKKGNMVCVDFCWSKR